MGNLQKSGKRKQTPEMRKDELDRAFTICQGKDGDCSLADLAEYLGLTERTIRKYAEEQGGEYEVVKGRVRKLKKA